MEVKDSELLWPLSSVLGELRLLGLWVPPPGHRLRHRLALAFVMVSHIALLLGALACIIMDAPSDLPQLSFIAYNCLTDAGLTCKMFSFSLDGQRLTELLRLLAESRQRFPDKAGHRARYQATAVKLRRFMQVTYRINTAYWLLAPIVRNIMGAISKNTSSISRDIPVPIWLPFDARSSPVYEILYSLELAFGFAMSETTVLIDGSLIALILQVAAELAVLNDNLAAGVTPTLKQSPSGVTITESIVQESYVQVLPKSSPFLVDGAFSDFLHCRSSTVSEAEIYQQLIGNIQHHQTIIRESGYGSSNDDGDFLGDWSFETLVSHSEAGKSSKGGPVPAARLSLRTANSAETCSMSAISETSTSTVVSDTAHPKANCRQYRIS
ncbi:uncharacterized protein LOC126419643 [Schistocerca serialis cubense]|uniref:uncharacterized protein LOC126419643 n=1 Tax=Schistocerca serialis cubense TaxID=2023355 RepID=UPI00214EEE49|nr:uncharacterized protein LOC126419643 [Schistocerca serialis cubense]